MFGRSAGMKLALMSAATMALTASNDARASVAIMANKLRALTMVSGGGRRPSRGYGSRSRYMPAGPYCNCNKLGISPKAVRRARAAA